MRKFIPATEGDREENSMNSVIVMIGTLAIDFGAYTAWARAAKPGQFKKLEAMKKVWGEKAGMAIHELHRD